MIRVQQVFFTYENMIDGAAIADINVEIPKGQVVLLCGESGSGKTTFSRLINGLIPTFYEGNVEGTASIRGKNIQEMELYELAPYVGSVFQNPKSQFYTLQTDTEIVFACENIGMKKSEILAHFDNTVELFQLEKLLGKSLFALSGGEKQKIACASVNALMPDIFVLDEPTSNLDIETIQDMQKILISWKEQGKTVIIAEHRLTWLKAIADRVIYFQKGKIAEDLTADQFWRKSSKQFQCMGLRASTEFNPPNRSKHIKEQNIIIQGFQYRIKNIKLLEISQLQIPKGSVVAVLGNNGAGKTTFARCLCGLLKKAEGTLSYNGKIYANKDRIHLCYMVMQDVNHQLFSESVLDEVLLGADVPSEENREAFAEGILSELDLLDYKDAHPMSLSGGQRQRVAIASAVATHKELLVFDEPTSGLDFRHMEEVAQNVHKLSDMGKTQFIITHDPELVSACCDYFLFMKEGEVISSGSWNEETRKYVSDYFKGL